MGVMCHCRHSTYQQLDRLQSESARNSREIVDAPADRVLGAIWTLFFHRIISSCTVDSFRVGGNLRSDSSRVCFFAETIDLAKKNSEDRKR